MKRVTTISMSVLIFLVFGGCVHQDAPPSAMPVVREREATAAPFITVRGDSKLTLAPDMASIRFGVDAREKASASEAIRAAAASMAAVREALAGLGIAQADMQTSNFSLSERYHYDDNGNIMGEPYYEVSNSLEVVFYDLENAGNIIDAAVEAGATSTFSLNFGMKNPQAFEEEALTRAFENARSRAEAMAAAAGKQVGEVLLLNDGTEIGQISYPDNIVTAPPKTDSSASYSSTVISVGVVSITASVAARFSLE